MYRPVLDTSPLKLLNLRALVVLFLLSLEFAGLDRVSEVVDSHSLSVFDGTFLFGIDEPERIHLDR